MGSKWAELPEKTTNGLGWVGRKVVENNVCPMRMGWAGLKPAQPAHCPTLVRTKIRAMTLTVNSQCIRLIFIGSDGLWYYFGSGRCNLDSIIKKNSQ